MLTADSFFLHSTHCLVHCPLSNALYFNHPPTEFSPIQREYLSSISVHFTTNQLKNYMKQTHRTSPVSRDRPECNSAFASWLNGRIRSRTIQTVRKPFLQALEPTESTRWEQHADGLCRHNFEFYYTFRGPAYMLSESEWNKNLYFFTSTWEIFTWMVFLRSVGDLNGKKWVSGAVVTVFKCVYVCRLEIGPCDLERRAFWLRDPSDTQSIYGWLCIEDWYWIECVLYTYVYLRERKQFNEMFYCMRHTWKENRKYAGKGQVDSAMALF